MTSYRN